MAQRLYTTSGRQLQLGDEIGAGGEGAVFSVTTDTSHVAKVYHKPIPNNKADKLLAMTRVATPQIARVAAWPTDLLAPQPGGAPVGLLMPRVAGRHEIHKLYGPAHRKLDFPAADWAFLLRTALNLAAAMETVHSCGCVVGDVNQGNILVGTDATVCFIDCDSFQLRNGSQCFRCEVGVAHYTPPELQSVNFRDVDRSINHDSFGLAVLIFQLLAMGRHPYAGRYSGRGDMPIERAIAEDRFAFGRGRAARQMDPPPHAISLDELGGAAVLFERAFVRSASRPDPREWRICLANLESVLARCSKSEGHTFIKGQATCPWCRLMEGGGPDFFLSVSLGRAGTNFGAHGFNLEACWRVVVAVPRPLDPRQLRPVTVPAAVPTALSPGSQRTRQLRHVASGFGKVGACCLLIGLAFWPLAALGGGLLVVALILVALAADGPLADELKARRERFKTLEAQQQHIERQRTEIAATAQRTYDDSLKNLEALKRQLQSLPTEFQRELRELESSVVERQLAAYLQRFFIDAASIPNIGAGRKAVLESYGIETAADVNMSAIRGIPGFGPALTSELLAWRSGLERRFVPDRSRGITDADRRALVLKYEQVRVRLEHALTSSVQNFQLTTTELNRRVAALTAHLMSIAAQVAQARADVFT